MKRKKHNENKRAQRFFNDVRMWSWESEKDTITGVEALYAKIKKGLFWCDLQNDVVDALISRNNNWSLVIRAITWHEDGEVNPVSRVANLRDSKLLDLEEAASKLRREILSTIKTNTIVDVGWLALSYQDKPRTKADFDLIGMGGVTEQRKMLWNYAQN